jgi:50S ribosomal protein L16 3-hydroxylase
MGSRIWTLGQHCTPDTPLNTESGLKVLEDFKAQQSFTLNNGDLLYIPPGVAHYGISVDNSLSYSLGPTGVLATSSRKT